MFKKLLMALVMAGMAATPALLQAARVSPMIVNVTPSGRASTARVELTNPSEGTFPVEVQMFRGEISETGRLALTPADELFLVFPAQIVVPPRSQQVFRVQYIGEPELAASEIFYMQIRQIPVQLDPDESGLQLVVNFNVLVNVVPDGARPEPVIQSVQAVTREQTVENEAGERTLTPVHGIEVRIVNQGTRYFTAGTVPWEISGQATDGTSFSARLNPESVAPHTGIGVVGPGRTRVFFIPTEKQLVEGTAQARLGT